MGGGNGGEMVHHRREACIIRLGLLRKLTCSFLKFYFHFIFYSVC